MEIINQSSLSKFEADKSFRAIYVDSANGLRAHNLLLGLSIMLMELSFISVWSLASRGCNG